MVLVEVPRVLDKIPEVLEKTGMVLEDYQSSLNRLNGSLRSLGGGYKVLEEESLEPWSPLSVLLLWLPAVKHTLKLRFREVAVRTPDSQSESSVFYEVISPKYDDQV